jgi:cation:H+ antiporter
MDLLYILGALILLLLGGDAISKSFSGLSQKLGLSAFSAGILLIAFATSLPELAINAYAMAQGNPNLALGNAIGSNVVNIGLTLSVAALAAPLVLQMRLLSIQIIFVLVASGLLLFFSLDGSLSRFDGALLLVGFIAALAFLLARGKQETAQIQAQIADAAFTQTNVAQNLLRFAIGAGLLFFGAKWIAQHAPAIGLWFGFTDLVTGLIIISIVTALPEVVVAVMLARQGKGDAVAGMVLGACLFNFLFILGGMSVHYDIQITRSLVMFEIPAAMAFALALYPLLGGDMQLSRRDALILLLLFIAWVVFAIVRTGALS